MRVVLIPCYFMNYSNGMDRYGNGKDILTVTVRKKYDISGL